MRLAILIIGELILLGASILIFGSIWTLLDEYFGKSGLTLMLILDITLAVIGLILINYKVKCELQKNT